MKGKIKKLHESEFVQIEGHEGKIMERGTVNFFVKPKVMHKKVCSSKDIQRFYMLLRPEIINGKKSSDTKHPFDSRLLILGAKTMPKSAGSVKDLLHWAFVAHVGHTDEIMKGHMKGYEYETKTEGDRAQEGGICVGQGVYECVHLHKAGSPKKRGSGLTKAKEECVFAYVLEVPEKIGDIQKSLNIFKSALFYMRVKNPNRPGTRDGSFAGLTTSKAHPDILHYPRRLQDVFAGKRVAETKFAPLIPASDFLDYERTQILMIALADNMKDKLGQLGEELEKDEHVMEKRDEQLYGKEHMEERVFDDLHMDTFQKRQSFSALAHGSWGG